MNWLNTISESSFFNSISETFPGLSGLSAISESVWLETVGWCLLHSVWQITLIALIVRIALAAVSTGNSQLRYRIALAGLIAAFVVPVATWPFVPEPVAQTATEFAANPVVIEAPIPDAALDMAVAESLLAAEMFESDVPLIVAPELTVRERCTAALQPWLPLAALVWLLGCCAFALRPLAGLWTISRLKRVGTSAAPEQIRIQFESLVERLRIKRPVRLLKSSLAGVPLVAGFFKPVVLIPASTLTNLSAAELEAVLAHELAHLRRYDDVVNLIQTLIETILFYHPGVWWISGVVRAERENCCDDIAVAVSGGAGCLANALLRLEQTRTFNPIVAANGGSLVNRIRRLNPHTNVSKYQRSLPAYWIVACAAILLVAGLLTVSLTNSVNAGQPATTVPAQVQDAERDQEDAETPKPTAVDIRLDKENGSIVISGNQADLDQIERQIMGLINDQPADPRKIPGSRLTNELSTDSRVTGLQPIELKNIDSGETVARLRELFETQTDSGELILAVDFHTDQLLAKGTPEQLAMVREVCQRMDDEAKTKSEIEVPASTERQDRLNDQETEFDAILDSLEMAVEFARMDISRADESFQHTEKLLQRGFVTDSQLDDDRKAQRTAQHNLNVAQQLLAQYKQQHDQYNTQLNSVRSADMTDRQAMLKELCDGYDIDITQEEVVAMIRSRASLVGMTSEKYVDLICEKRAISADQLEDMFWCELASKRLQESVFHVRSAPVQSSDEKKSERSPQDSDKPEVKVVPVDEFSLLQGTSCPIHTSFNVSSLIVDSRGLMTVEPTHQREFIITADKPGTGWIEAYDGENRLAAKYRVTIPSDAEILDRGLSGFMILQHREIIQKAGDDKKKAITLLNELIEKIKKAGEGSEARRMVERLEADVDKLEFKIELEEYRKSLDEKPDAPIDGPEKAKVEEINVELTVGESRKFKMEFNIPEFRISNFGVIHLRPTTGGLFLIEAEKSGDTWIELVDSSGTVRTRIKVTVGNKPVEKPKVEIRHDGELGTDIDETKTEQMSPQEAFSFYLGLGR